jgi:hypothetical protein
VECVLIVRPHQLAIRFQLVRTVRQVTMHQPVIQRQLRMQTPLVLRFRRVILVRQVKIHLKVTLARKVAVNHRVTRQVKAIPLLIARRTHKVIRLRKATRHLIARRIHQATRQATVIRHLTVRHIHQVTRHPTAIPLRIVKRTRKVLLHQKVTRHLIAKIHQTVHRVLKVVLIPMINHVR